jgi:AraC-like DNA-binding protein
MDQGRTPPVRPFVTETQDFGPAAQAYKVFRDKTADICEPPLFGPDDRFRFRARSFDLGAGVLIDGSLSSMVSRRPGEMIARGGVDHYQINLKLGGRAEITCGPRTVAFETGDLYIVDLSQPNVFWHGAGPNGPDSHTLTLVLPRGLLGPLLAAPDAVQGAMVSHKTAFGQLMADHMLALRRHAPYLSDGESRAAVASMAHLAAEAFGQAADVAPKLATSTKVAQAAAIKRYIDQNLGSARLEIGDLCRKFRLSRAALYRLFESEGGLAGYIQQRRLNRAFSMLISPAYRNWRLIDFAVDARFSSDATFIRAFRRLFGMTPGDARAQAERARAGGRLPTRRPGSMPRGGCESCPDNNEKNGDLLIRIAVE